MRRTRAIEWLCELDQMLVTSRGKTLVVIANLVIEVTPLGHPEMEFKQIMNRHILLDVELGGKGETVVQIRIGRPQKRNRLAHPAPALWGITPHVISLSRIGRKIGSPDRQRELVAEINIQDGIQ